MANKVQNLKVGYIVRIKPEHVNRHGDYQDGIATIVDVNHHNSRGYNILVQWEDKTTSAGNEEFFTLVQGDWDI